MNITDLLWRIGVAVVVLLTAIARLWRLWVALAALVVIWGMVT